MKNRFEVFAVLIVTLAIQPTFGLTKLVEPEWTFSDTFEGAKNSNFWIGSGASVEYGVVDPSDAENKVMRMSYLPNSEGAGDSWSEFDFQLGVDAVQVEMSWKQFVPLNYSHIEYNHKVFALWSGPYGKSIANISVSSEAWGSDDDNGALPSVFIGVDGNNYGHAMNHNSKPVWVDGEGRWVRIHIFLELAESENSYGRMEIYRDGKLVTGTHSSTLFEPYGSNPIGPNSIHYSTKGNFIDQGTLLGWANGASDGGFLVGTHFLIDDFVINANSTHGPTINVNGPSVPENVIKDVDN